jgi:hypothetical protein
MTTIKKQKTKADKNVKQLEPLCAVGGNVKWYSAAGNIMVAPENLKHRITTRSSNFTPGSVPPKWNVEF